VTLLELADAITEADAVGPPVEPWFTGLRCDHLYQHCPALRRGGRDPLRPAIGRGAIYPETDDGEDICGWCLRVWRAKQ
jgi:hypothetical protein